MRRNYQSPYRAFNNIYNNNYNNNLNGVTYYNDYDNYNYNYYFTTNTKGQQNIYYPQQQWLSQQQAGGPGQQPNAPMGSQMPMNAQAPSNMTNVQRAANDHHQQV